MMSKRIVWLISEWENINKWDLTEIIAIDPEICSLSPDMRQVLDNWDSVLEQLTIWDAEGLASWVFIQEYIGVWSFIPRVKSIASTCDLDHLIRIDLSYADRSWSQSDTMFESEIFKVYVKSWMDTSNVGVIFIYSSSIYLDFLTYACEYGIDWMTERLRSVEEIERVRRHA